MLRKRGVQVEADAGIDVCSFDVGWNKKEIKVVHPDVVVFFSHPVQSVNVLLVYFFVHFPELFEFGLIIVFNVPAFKVMQQGLKILFNKQLVFENEVLVDPDWYAVVDC